MEQLQSTNNNVTFQRATARGPDYFIQVLNHIINQHNVRFQYKTIHMNIPGFWVHTTFYIDFKIKLWIYRNNFEESGIYVTDYISLDDFTFLEDD